MTRTAILLLTLALWPAAAAAQDVDASAPPPDAPPDAPPGTGSEVAAEVEAPPSAPPTEAERLGREHYERGQLLFREESFAAALNEYRRAYELLEGHPRRPVMLFNMGLCHERLYRYDLAMATYRRYLEEAGEEAEGRADVEASVRALEGLLGRVRITTTPQARVEVWSAERQLGEGPGEVLLPAGDHVLFIRAAGYETVQLAVSVAARETVERTVELGRVFDGLDPVAFGITAAVAAATVAVAVGLGIHALSLRDAALAQPVTVAEDLAPIGDAALAADVVMGSGLAIAAVAIVLAVLTDWDGQDQVGAVASPGGGALLWRRAF